MEMEDEARERKDKIKRESQETGRYAKLEIIVSKDNDCPYVCVEVRNCGIKEQGVLIACMAEVANELMRQNPAIKKIVKMVEFGERKVSKINDDDDDDDE